MKLTKNEKKVLNLLLDNARITDSAIAIKLKISSQAVGKIRKKLESTVINSYSTNLSYAKIGIHALAISLSKLTPAGLDKGELQVEKTLLETSNIIQVQRLPNSSCTHIILYGFKDLEELDQFFHSKKNSIIICLIITPSITRNNANTYPGMHIFNPSKNILIPIGNKARRCCTLKHGVPIICYIISRPFCRTIIITSSRHIRISTSYQADH